LRVWGGELVQAHSSFIKRRGSRGAILDLEKKEKTEMKILLATDGSEYSEAAIDELIGRPFPPGTEVRVVSAVEYHAPITGAPFGVTSEYLAGLARESRKQAHENVERAAAKLRASAPDLEVTTAVLEESPKAAIVEEAERWKPDLIVVGSHGYGAIKRFLLGSVSQAVALHAPCSVEIVRRAGV
jgi:nucleotide-binding universal stress UspA family protein